MLKRSLCVVALACGCSPAVLPATARAPSLPSGVARNARSEAQLLAARPHHARHVARLAPPFAASGLTRRVPDSEPMTALVVAP
jgi:hypothetical protein